MIKGVYRVDFFDPGANLRAIVLCDAGTSWVDASSVSQVVVQLNFPHYLGNLVDLFGNDRNATGMFGKIIAGQDGNGAGILEFDQGLAIDDTHIILNLPTGSAIPYSDTWVALAAADPKSEFTNDADKKDVATFGPGWEKFRFGSNKLVYHVRNIHFVRKAPDPPLSYPLFTVERDIVSICNDASSPRVFPPPFSIAMAAGAPNLRVAQRPADNWFDGETAASGNWNADITGFQTGAIAAFWLNNVVTRYVGGLENVADGSSISLLPRFGSPGQSPADASDQNWRLMVPVGGNPGVPSLQVAGPLDGPAETITVNMSCDGFRTQSAAGLNYSAVLTQTIPPYVSSNAVPLPWISLTAALTLPATTLPTSPPTIVPIPQPVRIGSMDITVAPDPSKQIKSSFDTFQIQFEQRSDFWIPRPQLAGSLELNNIAPGGQDDPADPQYVAAKAADTSVVALQRNPSIQSMVGGPNNGTPLPSSDSFRREPALVIPLVDPIHPPPPITGLELRINESSKPGINQSLTLGVFANNSQGPANDILVIDRNPFTVARVQLASLASAASADTSEIAVWSNIFPEGAGWRISAGAGSFDLSFPPQGLSEAMVKGGSGNEPSENQPADFRLTPSLSATLQTTTQIQRYAEPGWNLRRVLGYPGERAPGAGLEEMSFEMLYGLTCNVNTPDLRMSEVFSRLGGFAGPLVDSRNGTFSLSTKAGYLPVQQERFNELNKSWADIYQQLISRLGVFELWREENEHDLLLNEGVTYDLRANAVMTQPAGSNTPPLPRKANPLAGGYAYGFDSSNLYQALWKNPHSSSAALSNPRFSALGGYGKQRASFSNDNIIIETEHAMGLLVSMSITIIGRIGNLWHRAKHVTVYQRSVRPSRQFYKEQPLLEKRPLLRKYQEYVEITQKARSYPESGPAGIGCGFLTGAEFKSVRINVDSAWGSDIGNGWMVPLWRRDASPSDVYPRPHITVQLATDPATGNDSLMCEILDPDKLCFYSDPTLSSNTDTWPAVEFVDYCISPPLRSILDNKIPDRGVEPGFGRFSYSVGTDASQINVVSQRATNAISSALKNVTFMRAQPSLKPRGANSVRVASGQLHDLMHNTLDAVAAAATNGIVQGHSAAQIRQDMLGALTSVKDQTAPFVANLNRIKAVDAVTAAARAAGSGSVDAAIAAALAANQQFLLPGTDSQPFQDVINFAKASVAGGGICQTLANAAGSLFDRYVQPLEADWQTFFTSARDGLSTLAANYVPVAAAGDTVALAVSGEVDRILISVRTALRPILSDLTLAMSLPAALTAAVKQLNTQLTNLQSYVDKPGPNFPAAINVVNNARAAFDKVLNDAEQLLGAIALLFGVRAASVGALKLDQLRTDLSTFEAGFAAQVATVVAKLSSGVKNDIDTAIQNLQTLLRGVAAGIQTEFQALQTALQGVLGSVPVNALNDGLETIRASLFAASQKPNPSDAIKAAINSYLADVKNDFTVLANSARDAITTQVAKACNLIVGTLSSAADTIINLIGSDLTTAIGNITDDFVNKLDSLRTQYIGQIDGVLRQALDAAEVGEAIQEAADSGLSLLRAFGAPPSVPTLNFDLGDVQSSVDAIAYFFEDAARQVDVSAGLESIVSQVSSALPGLSQLGLNMPVSGILDRLVPDLSGLDISELLPNIAGLNLGSLFSGIQVPPEAQDAVQVSHHIDPQTLRASLDVHLSIPLGEDATLFSVGPVTVTLDGCVLVADVHIAGGAGVAVSQTSSGSITADWHVDIAGTEIITFVGTTLSFDQSGHLHFSISPEKVRLTQVLQFLASFLEDIDLGGGFSLNLLPAGVQCVLDLPFPDMSFGVFGISNLRLGSVFELNVGDSGIMLTVGANLGRQEEPFTLTIFILGGAGWFEATVNYILGGALTADVSIGIMAAASLSISLGPISGGVYVYFGINAEFHTAGGMSLGILLMIQGRVSALGIIDVDITLLLEAEYESGGGLVGRGQVDISIKICWCFTLDLHYNVEHRFGGSGGSQSFEATRSSRTIAARHALALSGTRVSPTTDFYATAVTQRINFLT